MFATCKNLEFFKKTLDFFFLFTLYKNGGIIRNVDLRNTVA